MFVKHVLHSVHAQALALCAGKQYVASTALRFTEPCFQHGKGGFSYGCAAFFPALSDYVYMSAGSDNDLIARESGYLG